MRRSLGRWRHVGLPCLVILFLATSCAGSGYVHKSWRARRAFQAGNYAKALSWYQQQKPHKRDRLLYLLDEGVILHTAGRYQESIDVFNDAIELANSLSGAQVVSKTASIIANDNYIPYQGSKFERLLMRVFQVLNYVGLEDYRGALVEVRMIHNRFSEYFKKKSPDYLRNAFATYLSGLVWEANGKVNDAYIDYKKTYEIAGTFPALEQDLLRDARRLGFLSEYQRWRRKFRKAYRPLPKGSGELVLIVEAGRVPGKRSTEETHSLQIVPVPYYSPISDKTGAITIKLNGKKKGKAAPLYRVDEAAAASLAAEKPAIIARALARLAAKEGAAVAIGKEVDKDLGVLFGILVLATNRADLRSWLTLPASLQVAKFSLPPGTYDLELKWSGGTKQIQGVEVTARRKRFVIVRFTN